MRKMKSGLLMILVLSLPFYEARADVRLPNFFADNMMLQRDQPIRVWGWGTPGEAVTVALAGKNAATKVDEKSAWAVELPAMKQGENLKLLVTGKNAIVLTNVIVGDIWLCSGASNMEMPLAGCLNAEEDIKGADIPKIRHIKFAPLSATTEAPDVPVSVPWLVSTPQSVVQCGYSPAVRYPFMPWQPCSPQMAGKIASVAFYFAREIVAKTGVPIGILDANSGGTDIKSYIAPEGFALVPALQYAVKTRDAELSAYNSAVTAYLPQVTQTLDMLEKWVADTRTAMGTKLDRNPIPALPEQPRNGCGPVDVAQLANSVKAIQLWVKYGGKDAPPLPKFQEPPFFDKNKYCAAYNAMIHPVTRFPIKGVLWVHGFDDVPGTQALIGGWRKVWQQGDFPFYFAQHPARGVANDNPSGGDTQNAFAFVHSRDAMVQSLAIPNTGVAITIDLSTGKEPIDNVHFLNKYDVGMRFARWALNRDYGQKNVIPCGPIFKSMQVAGTKVRLTFDYTGSGLMIAAKEGRAPAVEDKAGKLKRFAIAGADKKWVWGDAVINGNTIVVSSTEIAAPVAVRYAYTGNPAGANLYNRDGLPAAPFRTDDWKLW